MIKEKNFKNINLYGIRGATTLFRFRLINDCIELFRYNKHFLSASMRDDKWIHLPILFQMESGKKYRLIYTVRSTFNMKRSFFFSVGRKTQEISDPIPRGEWISNEIEFESQLSGNVNITVTATDLPIAGHYLWIKQLEIEEA